MSKKAKTEKKEQTKKRAKHGEGTLVLRGKKYYARWVVGGKVYTRTTGTSDKGEALDKLAEFVHPFTLKDEAVRLREMTYKLGGIEKEISEIEEAEAKAKAKAEEEKPALAVMEAFAAYRSCLSRPNRAGGDTLDRYEAQFGEFAKWLAVNHPEVKELRHVTQEIAEEFLKALLKRATANTYNKRIVLFRAMWKHLAKTARLTENPWMEITKQVVVNHTRRDLKEEEMDHILASLTGEMKLLFFLGIYTGLRLGDCCLLNWSNIDIAKKMMFVTPRKTMKHGGFARIAIHPRLAEMLEEIPAERRDGYLLPEIANKYKRDPAAVSKRVQAVFEENGIQTQNEEKSQSGRAQVDVGFHSLRHTNVSMQLNAGAPLAVVQSTVCHASPMMTRHYFHESEAALRRAVAVLPSFGDSAKKPTAARLPKSFLAALRNLTREQLLVAQAEIAKRL